MSSYLNQLLFGGNSNCKESLTSEEGGKSHRGLVLEHLGVDSYEFQAHPTEKTLYKLVKKGDEGKDKEVSFFQGLEFLEKWHLTKEGSIYAYSPVEKARRCIYRTGRKPNSYSDIAEQLPERDNVQIQIINQINSSKYAFQQGKYMYLCKYAKSSGICDEKEEIAWTSKQYHRFYLEEDGSISAGHGSNKEPVLDKYYQPVNTMEALKRKETETLITIRQFLGENYSVINEKHLQYSYDQPEYRITFLNLFSTITTFEDLSIVRQEVVGKCSSFNSSSQKSGKTIKLVTSPFKIPTFEFNPAPYFLGVGLVLMMVFSLIARIRSTKNTVLLILFSASAYLTSSVNALDLIKKTLLEQQKKQMELEKAQRAMGGSSLTSSLLQTVKNYAQSMMWEVWFESCQVEEWNLYGLKLIFLSNPNLKPKQMTWVAAFGKVYLINSSTAP